MAAGQETLDPVIEGAIDRALTDAEAARRAPRMLAVTTAAALGLALGPLVPGARHVYGDVTLGVAAIVAAIGWGLFVLATLTYRARGPHARVYEVTAFLDELGHYGAILALIYLSGRPTSALWLFVLVMSFGWWPQTPRRVRLTYVVIALTHVVLGVVYLAEGALAGATLTSLMMMAVLEGHTVSARMLTHGVRVRAERDELARTLEAARLDDDRDRIARELHDGLGADVLALLLRLQRLAGDDGASGAAVSAAQAREIMERLRQLSRSLREPARAEPGE